MVDVDLLLALKLMQTISGLTAQEPRIESSSNSKFIF